MTLYVGIDPGLSGGVAIVDDSPDRIDTIKMPDTESGLWYWLRDKTEGEEVFGVVELVSGFIQNKKRDSEEGGNRQPGHTMFKFGTSYGTCRMALTALGLFEGEQWQAVRPQTWRKGLGIPKGSSKDYLKMKAKTLYPDYEKRITLKTADAVLLAVYCRIVFSRVSSSVRPTTPTRNSLWE